MIGTRNVNEGPMNCDADDMGQSIDLDAWEAPADDDGQDDGSVDDPVDQALAALVRAKILGLRELYVESSRDAVLAAQFERLLEEKHSGTHIRRWAGLVVKGGSGAGKTRMLKRFLGRHPGVHDFGGDDSNFVAIDVPSPVTNKSLGLEVLRTMYPQTRGVARTREASDTGLSDIWREARTMAAELGVWGLWIDEAHDLRNGGPKMLDILQASFKRWIAHEHRPILVLSGTPNIEDIILTREFRRRFLDVESPDLSADAHTIELRYMIAKYLRSVELGGDASLTHIMPRLIHAGTRQIGSTLDVVIEAIRLALLERADRLSVQHFARSYGDIVQCSDHDNPFIADDWAGIDTVLHRSRPTDQQAPKRRRRKREDGPW